MIINIYSIEKCITLNNIKYFKFYLKNISYIIMKNHLNNINFIDKLLLNIKNKNINFNFKNGFLFLYNNNINIICDNYELL